MKIFARLGEPLMPLTDSGPLICSACTAWMRSCPPSSAVVARPLVAFGEAALHERDRQRVLPGRRVEPDLAQPAVDLFDRRIQLLIDRLVVGVTADGRAIELLAVEQRDDRVLELHPRHFARQRHVADRQFVFAVGREVVLDAEAAARAEGHALETMLLPAGARARRSAAARSPCSATSP